MRNTAPLRGGWLGSILVKNGSTTVYSLTGPATGGLISYAGNGNVLNVIDNINGTWAYTYGGVNRLYTATATGHTFQYTDDAYGNMTCVDNGSLHSPCTPSGLAYSHSPQDNRISTAGYSYDNNGNLLTTNALMRAMVYDTENRLTCVVDPVGGLCTTSGATNYYYDPDGQRVAKTTGAGTVVEEYVYDFSGNQVSAHSSTSTLRNELYAPNARHMATYGSSILTYNFADWLGTERVRFNSNGTVSFTDMPYGMNLAGTGGDTSPMHFTGKQKDTETGLDYFGARFNSSNLGRFMTPDWSAEEEPVPYAKLDDPQTLNLYGYVRNNPLSSTDPSGHDGVDILQGAINAFSSDLLGGAYRTDHGNGDHQLGQAIGDGLATVVGTGEALLGAGGEVAGLALDATGVGAIAGVPVGAISTAAVVQGSSAALIGGAHLAKSAIDANTGKGPVKADKAPGVTAGGQATDEHGNKIGPSGETQVNRTQSNTREGANNKALNEGSRSVNHNNPKDGSAPHFHPADANGKKKPSSTHHEYPK